MNKLKKRLITLTMLFGMLLFTVSTVSAYGPIFFNVGYSGRGSSTIGLADNKNAPNNSATTMDSLNENAYNEVKMSVYVGSVVLTTKNHGSSGYVGVSYSNSSSTRLYTTHKSGGVTVSRSNYR